MFYDEGGGGASQGSPAAGLLFALSTKQLPKLTQVKGVGQKRFVGDAHGFATGNDKIRKLRQTWSKLTDAGDKFDFRTQNRKCAIVVCEQDVREADELFQGTEVQICTGHIDLGARVGSGKREATELKVTEYIAELAVYERLAASEPQVAHKLLMHTMLPRWNYWQRVTPDVGPLFQPVEEALHRVLGTILGIVVSPARRALASLPCRKGGFGLANPVSTATTNYETALDSTKVLRESIVLGTDVDQKQHISHMVAARKRAEKKKEQTDAATISEALPNITITEQLGFIMAYNEGLTMHLFNEQS